MLTNNTASRLREEIGKRLQLGYFGCARADLAARFIETEPRLVQRFVGAFDMRDSLGRKAAPA